MCPRFARSACLIAGGWVGVTELVFDGTESAARNAEPHFRIYDELLIRLDAASRADGHGGLLPDR